VKIKLLVHWHVRFFKEDAVDIARLASLRMWAAYDKVVDLK